MHNLDEICCSECNSPWGKDDVACPVCGCTQKTKNIRIKARGIAFTMRGHIKRMKARSPKYKHKIAWEFIDEDTVRRDDGVTPVHLYRDIDRVENTYKEVVTDLTTGEIIHFCEEPLSKHFGHGSAKFTPKDKNTEQQNNST